MDGGQWNGLVGGREIALRQESVDGGAGAVVCRALDDDDRQIVMSPAEWMYARQRQQLTVVTCTDNTCLSLEGTKFAAENTEQHEWYTGS